MLKEYSVDLHIHTCLSPCASLDLSPRSIVERAASRHLDVIAITDHHSARNVPPVMRLGKARGLTVIPGMEVQSREEVHLLTLFPDWPRAAAWSEEVNRHLPDVRNDPEIFGDQPVVDEDGRILGFEPRLLLNSLDLSLAAIQRRVEAHGGLIIPSHYDRPSFSLISQLGVIPEGMELEALEVTRSSPEGGQDVRFQDGPSRILSSDAHCLEEIGSARTVFLLAGACLEEVRLAFHGRGGRRILRRKIELASE